MKTEQVYRIVKTGDYWWVQARTLFQSGKWDGVTYFMSYEDALMHVKHLESFH